MFQRGKKTGMGKEKRKEETAGTDTDVCVYTELIITLTVLMVTNSSKKASFCSIV